MARDHDLMPVFYTLESIELYGIPVEVDGARLTLNQARILVNLVGTVWDAGDMELEEAVKHALPAFRKSFELVDGHWVSKAAIRLAGGQEFRNKFHREDDVARERKQKKTEAQAHPMDALLEAGARNNKKDKAAIQEVVRLALSQLSKEDRLSAIKALGYRVREK